MKERSLTALAVGKLSEQGRYADGGGLYLQVSGSGTKAWLFRYRFDGRERQMGLGPVRTVSLVNARERALACRQQLLDDIDPIEARRARRLKSKLDAARSLTFEDCAKKYLEAHEDSWRNATHRAQWKATLARYVYPTIGPLPVAGVDTGLVLKILEPIWSTKPETAGRVRGRVEAILDWAAARAFRPADNPARWRGHLDKLLPPKGRIASVKHHAAIAYVEMPSFMRALRSQAGLGARALEFAILTGARTGETVSAQWSEIDLSASTWTIPAERMKARREHRVPLSTPTLEILAAIPRTKTDNFIFIGNRVGSPLSNMALLMTLRRMGLARITAHGFRSTFRDWASEQTAYAREVCEAALAHTISDKVEAAYRRGDLFEKRRRLMNDWAQFCSTSVGLFGDIVPIRGVRS